MWSSRDRRLLQVNCLRCQLKGTSRTSGAAMILKGNSKSSRRLSVFCVTLFEDFPQRQFAIICVNNKQQRCIVELFSVSSWSTIPMHISSSMYRDGVRRPPPAPPNRLRSGMDSCNRFGLQDKIMKDFQVHPTASPAMCSTLSVHFSCLRYL
jgi:hypothetical protein